MAISGGLPRSGKVNIYCCKRRGHIVTIAGSSGRRNPRVDTPRHKQIFGVQRAPIRATRVNW